LLPGWMKRDGVERPDGNVAGAHFDEKIAKRDLENDRKKGLDRRLVCFVTCSLPRVRLRALSRTLAQVSVD
jgi:hypothetical protein